MGNPAPHRGLWLTIIVLGSVIAATGWGVLLYSAGATASIALAAAGCGFVALAGLGMACYKFLLS